jgi:hypothetical protein
MHRQRPLPKIIAKIANENLTTSEGRDVEIVTSATPDSAE